jgi:transposase-like protein/transposase Tn5 family protein
MDVLADPRQWAEQTFGSADVGDRRRTRRLVESAAVIAAHPQKPFTQIFDWNGLRGFYRLCDQPAATLEAVMEPHWNQTRQAMRQHPLVLILHDTTELDYTAHPALRGAGPIGDGRGRGFLQHNSLAVVPAPRRVLGLAYQQLRIRRPVLTKESTFQRRKRPRETDLWAAGIRAAGPAPESSCWVDVGDRGSDIYEAMQAARGVGHHFLFRAKQDRVVWVTPAHDQERHLFDYARSLLSRGRDTVTIPGRGGRPPRTAVVELTAAAVWVPAPKGFPRRARQPVLAAWVIRIWEPQPPAGVEPLEWVLLCSVPSDTLAELKERRDWYGCRWLVEVFHDIEKNGCSEEDRRFETADRLETCLAVLSVVAVRVFQLRCALEVEPAAPAERVATATEERMLREYLGHTGPRFTVRDFVRGVATLGGFLGRKCDGEPGVRSLWRGYQRLQDMLVGFQLTLPASAGFT